MVVQAGCPNGGLDCVLVTPGDLVDLTADDVVFVEAAATVEGAGVVWCGTAIPQPVQRDDTVLASQLIGSESAQISTVGAVVMNVLRFDGTQAETYLDAVSGAPQGCEWTDGASEFQVLEHLSLRGFGDQSASSLVRSTAADGTVTNIQIMWVRVEGIVAQVAIVPAIDEADRFPSALAELVDEKLQATLS